MRINVTNIQFNVNDESDMDRIYLKLNGNKMCPNELLKSFKTGGALSLNLLIDASNDTCIDIDLWGCRLFSREQEVFTLKIEDDGDSFQAFLKLGDTNHMPSYLLT